MESEVEDSFPQDSFSVEAPSHPTASLSSPRKIVTKKEIDISTIPKLNLNFSTEYSLRESESNTEADYNKNSEMKVGRPMKLKSIKKIHSPVRSNTDSTDFQVHGNKLSSPTTLHKNLPDIPEDHTQKLQPIVLERKKRKKLLPQLSRPSSELDDLLFVEKKPSNSLDDMVIKNLDPTIRPLHSLDSLSANAQYSSKTVPNLDFQTNPPSNSLFHIETNQFQVNTPWRNKVILPSLNEVSPMPRSSLKHALTIAGQGTKHTPLSPVLRS